MAGQWTQTIVPEVTEYTIVYGSSKPEDIDGFIKDVNAKLFDGWQPHGETWESPSGVLKQAMVRK